MLFRRLEFRTLSYDYDDRMKFMTDTHLARRAVHTQPVQEISDELQLQHKSSPFWTGYGPTDNRRKHIRCLIFLLVGGVRFFKCTPNDMRPN